MGSKIIKQEELHAIQNQLEAPVKKESDLKILNLVKVP